MTANEAASHAYFGLDPMWVSACILAVTYAIIMSEQVNRAVIALAGAGLMIIVGVLNQEQAIEGVDWNTLGLLTGMMILVSVSRRSDGNGWARSNLRGFAPWRRSTSVLHSRCDAVRLPRAGV